MADLADEISDAATEPAEASADGQAYKARTIDEMIKADNYKQATAAAANKQFGLRFTRISPPGAD